jgi:hypothetical protein
MREVLIAVVVLIGAPRAVLACPVCFGQTDSPLAVATNMAIFFMLGVTGLVLAAFATFILYLKRRGSAADGVETARAGAADDGVEAAHYLVSEKGSV